MTYLTREQKGLADARGWKTKMSVDKLVGLAEVLIDRGWGVECDATEATYTYNVLKNYRLRVADKDLSLWVRVKIKNEWVGHCREDNAAPYLRAGAEGKWYRSTKDMADAVEAKLYRDLDVADDTNYRVYVCREGEEIGLPIEVQARAGATIPGILKKAAALVTP